MTLKERLIELIKDKGECYAHDLPRNTMVCFYFCSDGEYIWYQRDGKESRYSRNCETAVDKLNEFIEKYEYARSRDLGEYANITLDALATAMGGYSQISLQTIADVGIGHFRNRGYDKTAAIELSLKIHKLLCERFNCSEQDVKFELLDVVRMIEKEFVCCKGEG